MVGPRRSDGNHEVATVLQRIDLTDEISLEAAPGLMVHGFEGDTLVRAALSVLARAAQIEPRWRVEIEKRIPVAAGLGGGSSDAAAALLLANETLEQPLRAVVVHELAHQLGTDVPFFLNEGPQLGRGDGAALSRLHLPQDYWVLLVLPKGTSKASTKAVYDAFDGERGFEGRRDALLAAVEAGDLRALPPNDLVSSPFADQLLAAGAFRADVSGAGPVVYGLFSNRDQATAARELFADRGDTWITTPAW